MNRSSLSSGFRRLLLPLTAHPAIPAKRATGTMRTLSAIASIVTLGASGGCGGTAPPGTSRVTGQSDFQSAPPYQASSRGANLSASVGGGAGAAKPPSATQDSAASQARTVQETDLYRLDPDGIHLYYLNSYRGLMVFDVSDIDHPKLLGRSAIFGQPVQMFVKNSGMVVVVVADWYGLDDNLQPFHGSIVRGFDATDPRNIQVIGDAKLGGWIQDTRIVGDVLYAVSQDEGWSYGYVYAGGGVGGGVAVSSPGSTAVRSADVIVSSVSFANRQILPVAQKTYQGYGGVFNVTPSAIMLAHPVPPAANNLPPPAQTTLQYLDISDPAGAIVERGSIQVDGSITGWGADNGRWNLDFADGKTAHVIGCAGSTYGCGSGYMLGTADFSNPDQPVVDSQYFIAATNGWTAAARFASGVDAQGRTSPRMYLSPNGSYYTSAGGTTPVEIFDLSNAAAPRLAGQTQITGTVWLMIPSGNQVFALGQDNSANSSQVSLKYLDVTNPTAPSVIGTSTFGDGWAWTPAAQTFKAFTHDESKGLVVLPFSGWSASKQQYNNGVQLIEFTPPTSGAVGKLVTANAANTKGYVERGIFANGRIVSLSDLALSVIDYSDPFAPKTTAELTLARNVIAAQPSGSTVAEISSDWWGNDVSSSEVRVLPASDAAEIHDQSQAPTLPVDGVDARVFVNGPLSYVVTAVQVPCPAGIAGQAPTPGGRGSQCTTWQELVTVVDLSNGGATKRGTIALPVDPSGWYWGWGWGGFYAYDWYEGGEIAQVGGDALAFRRWHANYSSTGQYIDASSNLYVVDLSNPDAPSFASTVITNDPNGWWGNMKVVGNTLYTTHYVWPAVYTPDATVRYYLDAVDLSDRKHPKIQASINVPGVLVGGSETDHSILYTIDYRWNTVAGSSVNDLDVIKLQGGRAYLQSSTPLDGWVGNVFVRGNTAYTSTQKYIPASNESGLELHQIDLSNPSQPVDHATTGPKGWWGWLVDVQDDRMLVTSGWGQTGLDIYKLTPNAAPVYDQFVRTLGWSITSVARQDNELFLSSGFWGVQAVVLK